MIVNFVGFGFGPLLVGALSDFVFTNHGTESLRFSLVVSQSVGIRGAFHYYLTGRQLRAPQSAAISL